MEIIIFIAVVVAAALLWNGYVKAKKADSDDAIDKWIPGGPGKDPEQHPLAKFNADADKPWPYGEKLPEGKIHVKTTDVSGSENRVEATAPQCGCGRSPTGFCVGLHKLTAEEWAVSDQNPNKVSVADVTAGTRQRLWPKLKKHLPKKQQTKSLL
jgi:hypothetical protein